MQVIEQHPYVEQVAPPLNGESAVGVALGEDADLGFLEDEIMKVGSLAHTDIDWDRVERDSLKILSARSKDLKVLGYLLLALQQGGDGERFALSLYLLNAVLESWWPEGWPYPGAPGQRARNKMFTQMLQRAVKGAANLSFDASVGDGRAYCLSLLTRLQAVAEQQQLPDAAVAELRRAVDKLPRAQDAGAGPGADRNAAQAAASAPDDPAIEGAGSTQAGVAASGAQPSAALGTLTLDPGNERATRQSLLKVADLLTGAYPERPLGYQVRRHAIWQNITSVPPTRNGKRSDLAAVSADRVADYQETLEKAPHHELWQRVEQSLSVSPFWLDGHWLSARVATALGCDSCAEAIRIAVSEFVERLPQVAELTFSDGSPFLSPKAGDWLWTASAPGQGGAANPWDQAYDAARELADRQDLSSALKLLESGLAEAREPRAQFYWRLASARLMKSAGLVSLADRQIADLKQQLEGLAVEAWEPALLMQLERQA